MYEENRSVGCDLAIEEHEMLVAEQKSDFYMEGVSVDEESDGDFIEITRVSVYNEIGAKTLKKPVGKYVTIGMPERFYGRQEIYERMCERCAKEIESIIHEKLSDDDTVLVVGLGNSKLTADALGPKVVESLMITRHLKNYIPDEIDEGIRPVCAISPGVLGTTGIETEEIINSLTKQIKPTLVIAIDALCSGDVKRINTTIQITDTGITPGAGVGNKRKTIDNETLGVPVVAIGVPTVVDAATIAIAGIETVADKEFDENKIRDAYRNRFGNMIVTPKDVESIISDISSVIANGINISLHRGITLKDIDRYV